MGVALGMKENLSYHMARHSFGTLTLTAGIPIEKVMQPDGRQLVIHVPYADSFTAVSYTHLDVYKRQGFSCPESRPAFNRHFRNREPAQPMKEFNFEKELLSVQDEDVYKRQAQTILTYQPTL